MKPVSRRFSLTAFASFLIVLTIPPLAPAQEVDSQPRIVTLESRKISDGVDNYHYATYSFKFGTNGSEAVALTRNNWDIQFERSDEFHVTMVVDDQSRIKDLGPMEWDASFVVPPLPAHEKPTREPSVKAVIGHMYLVHSKDTHDDHYSLFRVESLESGKSVTISWKRIAPPPVH